MPKSQNIEYKESWRDEYLKWICGFANAKENRKITNSDYQKINDIGKTTVTAELSELVEKGFYKLTGKGRGAKYELI